MKDNLKVMITRVQRGSFTDDSTGRVVPYAKVSLLTQKDETENDRGYDFTSASIDVDAFDVVCKYIGTQVNAEVEMRKASGNSYKMRLIKIEDIELS